MVVVDNSALIEMALCSRQGCAIQSLMLRDERAIAPELITYEAASVSRKLALTGKISRDCVTQWCIKALSIIDDFVSSEELVSEALNESIRLNHSVYDMFYFVLARRTGGTLVTLDRKLIQLCEKNGVNCIDEAEF